MAFKFNGADKMNKFAIVDLETTGNSAHKGDRIIEIGIVIYQDGQIIEQYSQLINPEQHISRFISYLTGITNEMVVNQPVFADVAEAIFAHFKDVYFVAHNVPFDLVFLNYELKQAGLPQINQPVIDTVELSRILLPQAPSFKLGHLSEWLSIEHDTPHRALSDAYVTTKLLDVLLKKLTTLPLTTIKQLARLAPDFKSHIISILANQLNETKVNPDLNDQYDYAFNLAFKPIESNERTKGNKVTSFGDYLDALFSETGGLTEVIPNYEQRLGQREMAEAIYHGFQSEQHALIEADTGTGKTLAYLIAAAYFAIEHNESVLISTYLIQLQDQLFNQEWKQLEAALPFDCQVAVLKGKSHYLNLAKFSQALGEISQNYDQVLTKAIILVWLTETTTGEIDEIQLPSSGDRLFTRISAQNQVRTSTKENKYENLYYQTAKSNAEAADLLIINHSLLADNIYREDRLLSNFNKLIVDEAHHLEHVLANRFGLQIDYFSYHKKLKSINYFIDQLSLDSHADKLNLQNFIATALEENEILFNYIYLLTNKQSANNRTKNDIGRIQYIINQEYDGDWSLVNEMAERLQFSLHDLMIQFNQLSLNHFDQTKQLYFIEELTEMKQEVKEFFNEGLSVSRVNWVETDRSGSEKRVYLYQQPTAIDQQIKTELIDQFDSVILTSATLTVAGQFEFIKEQLGLKNVTLIEHKIPTPFSYQDQAKLLLPNDFPIARYDDLDPFIEAACELIFSMADLTNGRMLVLFNSYDMLRKAYYLLRELLDDQYMIIAQGITSGSHERLKKNFQNFDQSILLGTNAFWEGLDIPGDDLSTVVMVRLPFDSPNHPIIKHKHDLILENKENPFFSYSLPKAVIRFKQGFGRLIRSQSDRGVIVVCDDRLMTKQYGQTFINSIPSVPIYHRRTSELLDLIGHSFLE